jgi:hypothetical protein
MYNFLSCIFPITLPLKWKKLMIYNDEHMKQYKCGTQTEKFSFEYLLQLCFLDKFSIHKTALKEWNKLMQSAERYNIESSVYALETQ